LIAVTVAFTAWVSPPTTSDSMTYHLARVGHWVQEDSVAFYPSHVLRQLHMPPWSEYAMLHLFLLSGGDRLANLVQACCFVGCAAGASLIARQLGGGTLAQALAAALCALLPMGILQGSSTQNDLVEAFWLVCLVHFLIELQGGARATAALGAGLSLGLAVLTKGTAYVYGLPCLVWLLALAARASWSAGRVRLPGIGWVAIVGVVALALNLPHYARNYQVSGSPLGPGTEGGDSFSYANEQHTPGVLASNLLRNASIHLA